MNENVAESHHGRQPLRKPGRQQFVIGKDFGNLPVFRRCFESKIRYDVIADVEHGLNRNLKVSFGAAGEEWIFEKRIFVRDFANLREKPHALTNAMDPG